MVGWVTACCELSPFRRRLAIRRGLISADFTMVSHSECEVALGLPLGAPMPTLPSAPGRNSMTRQADWRRLQPGQQVDLSDETVTMQVGEGHAVTVEKP